MVKDISEYKQRIEQNDRENEQLRNKMSKMGAENVGLE